MSIEINKSNASIASGSNLKAVNEQIAMSVKRLSSGKVDDPSNIVSLIEGNKFKSNNAMYESSMDNISRAISLLRVAEGAYSTINDNLQGLLTLSSQSTGLLQTQTRTAYQASADQLIAQIQSTSANTNFNGSNILDGSISANPALSGKYKKYAVEFAVSSAITGSTLNTTAGAQRQEHVTCATVVADNTLTVGGVTFTYKAASTNQYEIKLGSTDAETAANTVEALRKCSNLTTKEYKFDIETATPAQVNVTRIATGNLPTGTNFLSSSSPAGTLVCTVTAANGGNNGALHTERLTTNEAFLGTLPTIQLSGSGFLTGQAALDAARNFGSNALANYVGQNITSATDANTIVAQMALFITDNFAKVNEMVTGVTAMSWTTGGANGNANPTAWSTAQMNAMKTLAYENFGTAFGAKYLIDACIARINATAADTAQGTANTDITNVANVALATTQSFAAADHRAATYTVTIGERTYDAMLFLANSDGSGAGTHATTDAVTGIAKVYFIDRNDHSSGFEVQFDGYAQDLTDATDAQTILTTLNTELAKLTIKQTRDLDVDTSAGNVVVSGTTIGTMTGVAASFKNSSFTSQTFEDLTITKLVGGNIQFAATINGTSYTSSVAYTNDTISKARRIDMTDSSNNVFSLQLGGSMTYDVSSDANRVALASAIKNALGVGKAIKYLTGTTSSDYIDLNVDSASTGRLFSVNGVVQTIDLSTTAGALAAKDTCISAIDAVNASRAKLGALISRFQSKFETVRISYQNQKAVESSLTNVDVFSENANLDALTALSRNVVTASLKAQRAAREIEQMLLQ